MRNRISVTALMTVMAIGLCACGNDKEKTSDPVANNEKENVSKLLGGTSGGNKPDGSKPGEVKPADPKPTDAKTSTPGAEPKSESAKLVVPDEAKHSGFDYYGLANTGPVPFEVKTVGQANDLKGSRIFTLKKVEGGKAYFTQTHTDGLSKAGEYELMSDKTGIYVTSSSEVQMDGPQLEIPADPKPGAKWHTKNSIENTDYSVVGFEKVQTPNGVRDALLIKGVGTSRVNNSDVQTESKFWCVKGIGQVKCEIRTKPKTGQGLPQTVVMQESKK